MTMPPTSPEATPASDEVLLNAADAWDRHVAATEATNAAIPSIMTSTPAERALYDERYRTSEEAKREHWRTAIYLAMASRALLARIRQAEQERDEAWRENIAMSREAGWWKGRYETSEAAGIVEGWRERAEAAEHRVKALEDRVFDMRETLIAGSMWFSDYEQQHRRKNTPDGNEKAERNRLRAATLRRVAGLEGTDHG